MEKRKGVFYGWAIIPIGWVLYGFGVSPAYYSWGQFSEQLIVDLGLSAGSFGYIFGAFTWVYSAAALLFAFLQSRITIRLTITFGALLSSAGFFYMSRATSLLDCIVGFVVMGGLGIGLSTILPSQTLGQNWFLKYRARSIAIILTAGGVIGAAVPDVDQWFLDNRSWNDGWLLISGISALMAVVAFVFVRDRPEVLGQFRDGAEEDPQEPSPDRTDAEVGRTVWTAPQAVRTIQFPIMILAGLAYAVPWGIVVVHGRIHMGADGLGLSTDLITGLFRWMILVTIAGRLSASLGDLVSPRKVLAAAVLLEGFGVVGLMFVEGPVLGYISVTSIGLGFGAGYVSISVVFSKFFGRSAFAGTTGMRFLIGGTIGIFPPGVAGQIFDATGSYNIAFTALAVLCVAGAGAAFFCPAPGAPPAARAEAT